MSGCKVELANIDPKTLSRLNTPKFDYNNNPPALWPPHSYRNDTDYREKFGKIMNICMNHRLQAEYNLTGYTEIEYCVTNEDLEREPDVHDKIFANLIKIILSCVLISSVYDGHLKNKEKSTFQNHFTTKRKSKLQSAMVSFSVLRNWKKFLSTTNTSDDFKSIHAIKVIYCFIILMTHVTMMYTNTPKINNNFTEIETWSWKINFLSTATVATTTFFVITGMLMANGMFKTIEQQPKFKKTNLICSIVRRYLR